MPPARATADRNGRKKSCAHETISRSWERKRINCLVRLSLLSKGGQASCAREG